MSETTVELEKNFVEREFSSSRIRSRIIVCGIAFITAICLTATIFFAYNCSLEQPRLPALVAKSPERTILILNVLSQVTLFFLADLTSLVLDATRWALACSTTGTSALTFFILSQATSFLGVLYMSFGSASGRFGRHNHRLWGVQRIGLTVIRVLLGVVLLADVSFKATYRELQEFPLLQSGLTEMNTTIPTDPEFTYYATANFWWHFPAIFTYSHAVAPTTCSGDKCKAFFFSSPLSLLKFLPNSPNVSTTDSPLATTFVEKNSPGYQIEFSPIDFGKDPPVTLSDCRVFGIPFIAFQLCLKEGNDSNSLMAAWNACPYDVAQQTSCLNTTEWRTNAQSNTKMTISKRHGSTVFDRQNLTVLDVTDLSDPIPISYNPDAFFGVYETVFNIDLNETNIQISTPYLLLLTISGFLQKVGDKNIASMGGVAGNSRLMAFLATPVVIYNDAWLGRTVSNSDMGTSLALSTASYRVYPLCAAQTNPKLVISPTTLYSFMVGGLFSFLWCGIVLVLSFTRITPGTSFFPEIDFASKLEPGVTPSLMMIPSLHSGLSMSDSWEIKRALARSRLYLRWSSKVEQPEQDSKESIPVKYEGVTGETDELC